MRDYEIIDQNQSKQYRGFKTRILNLWLMEMPSWLALVVISICCVFLSGCFSARHPYGLDNSAYQKARTKTASAKSDPLVTGALPTGQQTGWSPYFYPGTGVKPGQNEPQSAPFTPKGIESAKGLPPKPNVAPVDLPAPPLPLPESTSAPSTTLFGHNPIGRQAGISSRGPIFGNTALGGQPRYHQPTAPNTLQIFPTTTQPPAPGFRVANNQAVVGTQQGFHAPSPQPLPFPNIGSPHAQAPVNVAPPPPVQLPNQPSAHPASPAQISAPQIYQSGLSPHMSQNSSAYPKPPVPQGANLVVTGNGYLIDTGDELNIRVLGQKDLTGKYKVDSTGAITMPMISTVQVRGRTVSQIANLIQARLRQGFLRTPSVSVEVNSARPFFILGQVKKPGRYNYVNGLTVSQAVAMAGGYEPRAKKGKVKVTRQTQQGPVSAIVPNEEPIMPGDTIFVKQRWF